jgi:putative SOS response-associated peptidase YedK
LYNVITKKENKQLSLFEQNMDIFYTIITKNANDSVSHIHNRMPLIFSGDEIYEWMNGQNITDLMKTDHRLQGEPT